MFYHGNFSTNWNIVQLRVFRYYIHYRRSFCHSLKYLNKFFLSLHDFSYESWNRSAIRLNFFYRLLITSAKSPFHLVGRVAGPISPRCSCPLGIIMDRWSQRSNALNGTLATGPSSIFGLAGFTSCERCRYNREKDLCWCCEKHGGLLNSLTKKLQKTEKTKSDKISPKLMMICTPRNKYRHTKPSNRSVKSYIAPNKSRSDSDHEARLEHCQITQEQGLRFRCRYVSLWTEVAIKALPIGSSQKVINFRI